MTIEERMIDAVTGVGWEITQRPVRGDADRYASFEVTSGTSITHASDELLRVRWLVTLHLWTREPVLSGEVLTVLQALAKNGMYAESWGPSVYEDDTRWYHFPLSIAAGDTV